MTLNINAKEMLSILYSLKSFSHLLKNCHIKALSDNTTAIGVLNKMGSTKSEVCDKICHLIWNTCRANNVWITCTYISGIENIDADRESRNDYKPCNWMLNKSVFNNACEKFNFYPEIDLFANL